MSWQTRSVLSVAAVAVGLSARLEVRAATPVDRSPAAASVRPATAPAAGWETWTTAANGGDGAAVAHLRAAGPAGLAALMAADADGDHGVQRVGAVRPRSAGVRRRRVGPADGGVGRGRRAEGRLHGRPVLVHGRRGGGRGGPAGGQADPLAPAARQPDRRVQLREQPVLPHPALPGPGRRRLPPRPLRAALAVGPAGAGGHDRLRRRPGRPADDHGQQHPLRPHGRRAGGRRHPRAGRPGHVPRCPPAGRGRRRGRRAAAGGRPRRVPAGVARRAVRRGHEAAGGRPAGDRRRPGRSGVGRGVAAARGRAGRRPSASRPEARA